MRYPITPTMEGLLTEIVGLMGETRPWLGLVSPAARSEWDKLRDRFPCDDDLRRGSISLSEPEIGEMCSKFRRFREIVSTGHPQLRPAAGFAAISVMTQRLVGLAGRSTDVTRLRATMSA